jgi:glycosyltransferase involved in cell wall biosynthesis
MNHRVLWLTKGLGLGGAERLLTLMAPRLDQERFVIDVAYLLPWKDAFVDELQQHGIRAVCLGASGTIDLAWVRALRKLLAERRYAIVHTHSPVPAAAARLLARPPTRLVHTEHNVWDRYRWPTYAANVATYHRNDAVFAVSDGVTASVHLPRWVPHRTLPPVETLLHGVEPDLAPHGPAARLSARTKLGLAMDVPVVGCVANLTPKKDHAGLLDAIERVREHLPDVVLLLIGSGPLEDELRTSVRERRLGSTVRLLGSRDDVAELLPSFDVFVLSSRFEGLPISLLEAMAAEIACVSTAVGGIPEAITDGVEGRLVPPGDPTALAGALTAVLTDETRRRAMGEAGRRRVVAAFSIDRAVRRTEELYGQLLVPSATPSR